MKLLDIQHTYSYNWQTITTANWRKYPNELSSHVLSCDVISREVDPSTGILKTERLLKCKQNVPYLIRSLATIPEVSYFREVSYLDPKTQTYTATTINLSLTNLLTIREICTYKPDPSNPNKTLFQQQCMTTAGQSFSAFGKYIEDAAIYKFGSNASRGRAGLELVINKVLEEVRDVEDKLGRGLETLEKDILGLFEEKNEKKL
ncbi:hypothetical protein HK099_008140 [Clydaea vesicula]|uniref:PRELI/MSF1 domain-containing protein n=1 Tax=Clydaea vesicula TaxID=447962 RepID=A0AAD5TXR4_9FUNG|nr:hypothetical protein HK099_008140 [Clydaea vesicula]KAJ3396079.1 hypothetical protein HDU92_004204 [Lobulomyces angularis]